MSDHYAYLYRGGKHILTIMRDEYICLVEENDLFYWDGHYWLSPEAHTHFGIPHIKRLCELVQ
jgi:hypothetical protein